MESEKIEVQKFYIKMKNEMRKTPKHYNMSPLQEASKKFCAPLCGSSDLAHFVAPLSEGEKVLYAPEYPTGRKFCCFP